MIAQEGKILMISLSLVILAVLVLYSDPGRLLSVISGGDASMVAAAFLISNVAILVRCAKWKVLLHSAKFRDIVPVQLLGVTISNFSPGKAAEPAKAVLLKMKSGRSVSEGLVSVLWERILDILVLVVLAFSALQMLAVSGRFLVLGATSIAFFLLLLVVLFVLIKRKGLARFLLGIFKKMPFTSRLIDRIDDSFIENFYNQNIGKEKLAASFFLTLVAWVLDGLVFYFAFRAVGIEVSPVVLPGLIALATIVGIVSFLPGGIGSMEVTMLFLLGLQNISSYLAVPGVLLARFLSIWYVSFLGALSFYYLSRKVDLKDALKQVS